MNLFVQDRQKTGLTKASQAQKKGGDAMWSMFQKTLVWVLAVLIALMPNAALAQSGGNCSVFRSWIT